MRFIKFTMIPIILAIISIIVFSPIASAGTINSPLKQFSMGTAAEDILCKEGLQLMIRSSGEPACVKHESTTRLVDSNWGTIVESMKRVESNSHQRDQDMMMKQEQSGDQETKHKPEMKQIDEIDVSMSPPIEGSEDALITIIEFGDFQCPKCDQWFQNEKPIIAENYIDTGKANLYFVDFPFLGDDSISAANASYCADEQGKYWEYHTALYNNQGGINDGWASPAALKAFAITVGLNQNEFTDCLESDKHADRVFYNKQVGLDHNIEGTPVFFIMDSNGNHKKIEGPQPASIFADTIDSMLDDRTIDMSTTTTSSSETTMSEEPITSIGGIDISMAAPIEGSPDAPYTIIEFGDFQCPKCDQWFQNEKPDIVSDLILTDITKLYFVDFTFLGDDSISAANASYCADEQGKYWEYHTHLYNNQGGIEEGWASVDNLKGFAVELGLDTVAFDACLDSEKYSDKIVHNKQVGISHGVEGTPAFFIVSPDGAIERIDGPQPASTFMDIIG